MPNWCENDLTVKGPKDKVQEFIQRAEGPNGCLDFNAFVPYPERFLALDKAAEEWDDRNRNDPELHYGDRPKDGFNQGGYEWCIANCGTKWNACEASVQFFEYLDTESADLVRLPGQAETGRGG